MYYVSVMEAALHSLSGLDEQIGAPWPHQQRDFLQWCVQLLELVRDHRLQSEYYPAQQQFINDCCADASALLEMMEGWGCDWRVAYGAIRLAAAGMFVHPDLGDVRVAGVPVKALVEEVLSFISKRGLALGKLEAAEYGTWEDWGETAHPATALLLARPDINQLARAILSEFFEEPQCAHSLMTGRAIHFSES
jgi:hypothetical protein